MAMIKRNVLPSTKNASVEIVKEKKSDSNYCCHECKKCFSSLEDMENHICK